MKTTTLKIDGQQAAGARVTVAGYLKAADDAGDKRVLVGQAVPYGEPLERYGETWIMAEGSAVVRDNAKLYYGHDHLSGGMPIGKWLAHEHQPAGLQTRVQVSKTTKGDEVYELAKDGVLDRFSIGFYFGQSVEDIDPDTGHITRTFTEIDVFEVSVVPEPAFDSAVIETVLSAHQPARTTPRPQEKNPVKIKLANGSTFDLDNLSGDGELDLSTFATGDQFDALSGSIDTLQRQLATMGGGGQGGTPVYGSSFGELVKAVALGDEAATKFYLAWTGGTSDDSVVKETWVGDLTRIIDKPRRIINAFSKGQLPAEGLSLEYAKLLSDTTQVEEQAEEGDDLAYGKVAITVANTPVRTFGGWSSMSRQAIERANVNIVDTMWQALAAKYAATTEKAARIAVNTASGQTITGASLATFDGWIDFLIDAADHLDGKGLTLDGVLVDKATFKAAAKLKSGDKYLLDREQGSVNVTGLSGTVLSVPLTLVADISRPTAFNESALKTYESSGSPVRLQDANIVNLTEAFSLYGYAAFAVQDDKALVRPPAA